MSDSNSPRQSPPSADRLIVVGADHKSSTMNLRDRLFLRESALPGFYDRLRQAGMAEAVVLSTVDRTEIIALHEDGVDGEGEIRNLLAAQAGLGRSEIARETYALEGREAVKHVFAVASALDSLVVGDVRVQESVRAAYELAVRRRGVGPRLSFVMERAFALVETIERQTELTRRPSSIPAAAVHVARDLHGDLARCRALLIGAGEMGELLAQALVGAGLAHLVVTHPNAARAEACAHTLNCHAAGYDELPRLLETADIVLTSVNTRHFVLDRDMMRRAVAERRRKPIFVIDTGVPGDVDPAVAEVEDAFVYTLDDLERVTRMGTRGFEKAVSRAWDMVTDAAAAFESGVHPVRPGDNEAIESLRRESLRLAGGDAEKATRLLVERLMRLKRDS
jgi:glutamyl-tRNA reductase